MVTAKTRGSVLDFVCQRKSVSRMMGTERDSACLRLRAAGQCVLLETPQLPHSEPSLPEGESR